MNVESEIRRRIRDRGAIPFTEFMDLAMYWPDGGYYQQQERQLPGDYYTSPMVHPAFGTLLSLQLFQMWKLLGQPDRFTVVEAGSGNGLLCSDIVSSAAGLPEKFALALEYLCIDLGARWGLEGQLSESPSGVWRIAASGLPLRGIRGCILSNELLDAMPVHRVTLTGGKLQETYVTLDGDELVESSGEPSTPGIASRLDGLRLNLAEGQTAELNLELDQRIGQAAAALDAGFLLSIDYGDIAEELYSPERRFRGTLTTFYQHVQTDAPLQRVGRQDITAQVDFTTLVNAGRKVGIKTLGYTTQGEFLSNLGLEYLRQGLASLRLPGSSLQSNRVGMLQLARPDGLGKFRVLAQGKNVEGPHLWGFAPSTEAQELLSAMPVPLLTDKHLSLMEATYPNAGMGFEHLWPWGDPDEPRF